MLKADRGDTLHNTTRFIILSAPAPPQAGTSPYGTPTVTTFIFRVRNIPRALQGLGRLCHQWHQHDETGELPARSQFFATQFYADVEGHPDDPAVKFALEELEFFSREVKVFGSYPASPFRDKIRSRLPISGSGPERRSYLRSAHTSMRWRPPRASAGSEACRLRSSPASP